MQKYNISGVLHFWWAL